MILAPQRSSVARAPLKCGECGERRVTLVKQRYEVTIDHDGRSYPLSIPDLALLKCAVCGNRILPDAAGELVNEALRQAAGLLSPSRIKHQRLTIGLTQKELADQLRIAEATLSRWETGAQIQQRGYDLLLRLFFELNVVRNHISRGLLGRTRPPGGRNETEEPMKGSLQPSASSRDTSSIAELAIWLCGAADDIGLAKELRAIVRRAAEHADEMYSPLNAKPYDLESDDDSWGIRELVGHFASALDEDVRERKTDEAEDKTPKRSKKVKKPKKKGRR